jgi:hypothetical protein
LANGAGVWRCQPWYVTRPITVMELGCLVTVVGVGSVTRLGVYGSDETGLPVGAPLIETSALNTAVGTGWKGEACAKRLEPGLYWAGLVNQVATVTFRAWMPLQQPSRWVDTATITTNYAYMGRTTSMVAGGLTSPIGAANHSTAANAPRLWAKVVPD